MNTKHTKNVKNTRFLALLLACAFLTFSVACKDKQSTPKVEAPLTPNAVNGEQPAANDDSDKGPALNQAPENNDAAPAGTFSSGLEKSKHISALNDAEKQQLLDATNKHVPAGMTKESLDKAMCTFAATIGLGPSLESLTTDTMLQEACAQSRDTCVEQIAMSQGIMDIGIFPADCQATVAETEECLSAQNQHGAKFLKEFPTCDALTLVSIKDPAMFAGVEALNNAPPECAPLVEKCPGFLTPPEQ